MPKKPETIIWQSKRFPKLQLTREHLEVLREAYPNVGQFYPELKKAEAWLFVNENRVPKKNWRNFINNWMRNASRILHREDADARARSQHHARQGDAAARTPHDPRAIKDIMGEVQKRQGEQK
jgi:hypothetical protein